jgi:hypothetical protein
MRKKKLLSTHNTGPEVSNLSASKFVQLGDSEPTDLPRPIKKMAG